MMQAETITAIIGIIGIIATVWGGSIYAHRITAFHNAALKFREVFTPTLSQLSFSRNYKSTHEAPDIDGQIRAAIPIQTQAVEDFRFFVAKRKRGEYQQAWEEYKKAAEGGIWVAKFPGSPNEKDPYGFIESKIHAILQFAK